MAHRFLHSYSLAAILLVLVWSCPAPGQQLNYDEQTKLAHSMTNEELLKCLDGSCTIDAIVAVNELADRKPVAFLIKAYRLKSEAGSKGLIVQALSQIPGDDTVASFMRSILDEDKDDWYRWNYVAELGDRRALARLAKKCSYPIPSYVWAKTLDQFGKYKYRPAIPCLIQWVDAASLNAAGSAYASLQQLYPDAPKDLPTPEDARVYFEKQYRQENASRRK